MTRNRRTGQRAITRRPPDFDGDFGSDQAITDVLARIPDWDGATIEFGEFRGTSAVGLGPASIYPAAFRSAPAPPPAPDPDPDPRHDVIARDMAGGWPHLFEIRCAYPAASHETPIPCGRVHRDPSALSFWGLRKSAYAAGWHLDAFERWACPSCCQTSPGYRTLYPVTHWHPDAATARLGGDYAAEFWLGVAAEVDMLARTADSARHGRHAAGTR